MTLRLESEARAGAAAQPADEQHAAGQARRPPRAARDFGRRTDLACARAARHAAGQAESTAASWRTRGPAQAGVCPGVWGGVFPGHYDITKLGAYGQHGEGPA